MDVLIVEDEPALLESLVDGIQGALPDYEVAGAPSVERAEDLLRGKGPLLIITDIRLPGKSGLEFLMDIHREHPDVKFIVMSAYPRRCRRSSTTPGAASASCASPSTFPGWSTRFAAPWKANVSRAASRASLSSTSSRSFT